MKYVASLLALTLALAALPARAAPDPALSAEANQAYRAANAGRKGVVRLADGLQYRVLQSGTGRHPIITDTAQINFSARLINGTVFDGTSSGLPANLAVSAVIRGLSEALLLMHVGDHWQLVIPPELGFGAKIINNGQVPADQTLIFDVTLVSAAPAPPGGVDPGTDFTLLSGNNAGAAVLTFHP